MGWDWTFTGELVVGLAFGIGIGGWFVVDRLEVAALRIVTNPNVRKLANAADKFQAGAAGGGWAGVASGLLNWISGGKASGQPMLPAGKTKVVVVDAQGRILEEGFQE